MPRNVRLLLLPLLCLVANAALAGDYLPPDEAFPVEVRIEGETLRVEWRIADGYYLYRDKYRFAAAGAAVRLGKVAFPPAEPKDDPNFGRVLIDKHGVVARLPILRSASGPGELMLHFQGCAAEGLCYPPQTRRFVLDWPQVAGTAVAASPSPRALGEDQSIAEKMAAQGTLWVVASFFGFGVLLALTPCVFPMIPILSGLIVGRGEAMSTRRALALSGVYVLGMAATYTAAGMAAALAGRNLQAAMQHPAALIGFAALFVALALSMFDVFQLQLPAGLQSRLDGLSRRQHGGTLLGAAAMGVLGALVVGPCVAPPLAGALLYIGQTGDVWLGGGALFSLGLGMGLPLLAAGTALGGWLPRAGRWMEAVKQVFGVLMLVVALLLLERVLPGPVMLLLWALLLAGVGVVLGGLDFSGRRRGAAQLGQALGVLLVAGVVVELTGAAGGADDPRQPLRLAAAGAAPEARAVVTDLAGLQRVLAGADKPVVADFYADWCTACKDFERRVLSDPGVRRTLAGVHLVTVDVTAADAAARELQSEFELLGPPVLLGFVPGQSSPRLRHVGELNRVGFEAWLDQLLAG